MDRALYPSYHNGALDPQAEALLTEIAAADGQPLSTMTPKQARRVFLAPTWLGQPREDVRIENLHVGNRIPMRSYLPGGNRGLPILVFFHGGGFVLGALEEFDAFCAELAAGASCVVVSVGYRLAPEHKYPAAIVDATAAIRWIASNASVVHGDPERMAVAGDSAGANLATVATLIARDSGFPRLIYQVLLCPWLDLASFDTDSYRLFGDGLWLSTVSAEWYRGHYLQSLEQASHPHVSPLRARDLSGLPPAYIVTAEFDVLRDEAKSYADRMRKAGTPAELVEHAGMLHDFIILPGLFDQANEAIGRLCAALRAVF
jgi:acetyl esterase